MIQTIKKLGGLVAINIIIIGLTGCTSTPAPWAQTVEPVLPVQQEEDEEKSLPAKVVIPHLAILDNPDRLAGTELKSVAEDEFEPVRLEASVVSLAAEVIVPVPLEPVRLKPVVLEKTAEQKIMALSARGYAVQIYAASTSKSIEKFRRSKNLVGLKKVKTKRSDSIVYVLVDIHAERHLANAAATDLEMKTGLKPWIRSIAGLQKIIVP